MSTKKCPFCAEEILEEAVKCKHCGSMLTNQPVFSTEAPPQDPFFLVTMVGKYRYPTFGRISEETLQIYKWFKEDYPLDDERKFLNQIWEYWLAEYWMEIVDGDEEKKDRFRKIGNKHSHYLPTNQDVGTTTDDVWDLKEHPMLNSLIDFFDGYLYVEKDVTPSDGEKYLKALKTFNNAARMQGLDFDQEYKERTE